MYGFSVHIKKFFWKIEIFLFPHSITSDFEIEFEFSKSALWITNRGLVPFMRYKNTNIRRITR